MCVEGQISAFPIHKSTPNILCVRDSKGIHNALPLIARYLLHTDLVLYSLFLLWFGTSIKRSLAQFENFRLNAMDLHNF